jgi:hypothetical protein
MNECIIHFLQYDRLSSPSLHYRSNLTEWQRGSKLFVTSPPPVVIAIWNHQEEKEIGDERGEEEREDKEYSFIHR